MNPSHNGNRKLTQSKERRQRLHRTWIQNVLRGLQEREWYGTVTIKIEGGLVRRLQRADSLIPPESESELEA